MVKILNFGSLNMDYTYDVEHFVRPEETIASFQMQLSAGGKGLNQSVAVSRSGAETYHAGAVGQHSDNRLLFEVLENAGVNTKWITSVSEPTGHAIIQRDASGQNCILLFGGANKSIAPGIARQVMAHFSAGDWIILQNEISSVDTLMEIARERGMHIAFNPAPMTEQVLSYPLHLVDLMILNEIEGAALCGTTDTDGRNLLHLLKKKVPACQIVLTLGKNGAWYQGADEPIFQPAFSVSTVDTTGAGDTFAGYFLGALICGMTPSQAMRQAAAAAALAVTKKGAALAVPDLDSVRQFLEQHTSVS